MQLKNKLQHCLKSLSLKLKNSFGSDFPKPVTTNTKLFLLFNGMLIIYNTGGTGEQSETLLIYSEYRSDGLIVSSWKKESRKKGEGFTNLKQPSTVIFNSLKNKLNKLNRGKHPCRTKEKGC